jgi:hypothetical protein
MTIFFEDRSVTTALATHAVAGNLRRNLAALFGTLADTPLSRFVASALDDEAPVPSTGLMPGDRLEVLVRRLRAAGVAGDLEGMAASLARGGWDTWVDEIAPLLKEDPHGALEALDAVARLRTNLGELELPGVIPE